MLKNLKSVLSHQRSWLIVIILSMALGVILHWPALIDPYRMHDNWRQVPHWINPDRQQFQDNDLMLEYARFNTSPFSNFLYTNLAKLGPDILWGKVMAILFFVFAVTLVFITAKQMFGSTGAWFSALIYAVLPCQFSEFSGGFMSALSASLLILTIYFIYTQKWWWILPLIIFQSLSYPMVAIHSAVILLMDFCYHDFKKLNKAMLWKKKILPLFLSATAMILVILLKYLGADHPFGDLVGPEQIGNRLEFTRAGRYPLIPIPDLWEQFMKFWGHGFHISIVLISMFFLRKNILSLPRGLYALLIGSALLYKISEYVVMKLYIPDRYLHFSLPLFFALAAGYWLHQMFKIEYRRRFVFVSIILIIFVLGTVELKSSLRPALKTYRYHRQELYSFIENLPGQPLLAAPPKRASEISTMTGKSVLVSQELCHPWWTEYWTEMSQRFREFYLAYYATDPNVIRSFITKYNIDYLLVEPVHFRHSYIYRKKRYCMEPFNIWLRTNKIPSINSVIGKIPSDLYLYHDGKRGLISTYSLLSWIDSNYLINSQKSK